MSSELKKMDELMDPRSNQSLQDTDRSGSCTMRTDSLKMQGRGKPTPNINALEIKVHTIEPSAAFESQRARQMHNNI